MSQPPHLGARRARHQLRVRQPFELLLVIVRGAATASAGSTPWPDGRVPRRSAAKTGLWADGLAALAISRLAVREGVADLGEARELRALPGRPGRA